jgi:ABC-type spermidine/putrescine transport system permease subunit II
LACSILVVPPGVTTVPIRVFGLIHAGVDDQVAGLCLLLFVGVAAAVAAVLWLLRRHDDFLRANRSWLPFARRGVRGQITDDELDAGQ